MSSINSVRIPGLATGMDTNQMIKDMLSNDQSKIDKVKQNQQISTWKQDKYREIIKDVKGLYDKYFSVTSKDYILGSKSLNTLTINSSNGNVITASSSAGSSGIDYKFKVESLAKEPQMTSGISKSGVSIQKNSKLKDLGLNGEVNFKISTGDGKDSKVISLSEDDTIDTLIEKINSSTQGDIKASFSDMTGKLTIKSNSTGENSIVKIVDVSKDVDGNFIEQGTSNSLDFLGLKDIDGVDVVNGEIKGSNSKITVMDSEGNIIKELSESKNSFNIDGITYSVNGVGEAKLSSTQDVTNVVDKMKSFIEDYNKIMDSVYSTVTERKSRDYAPLTDAQKEDMTEKEIEQWEEKAKAGMLRNDSELRSFMEDIKNAMFSPFAEAGIGLSEIGITSASDYNKQGQIELDEEKFTKALKENGDLTQKVTTGVFEKVKDVMYKYAGSSNSIFVKKAGVEKSSTAINNIFSNQIKKQEDQIKDLMRKMKVKEQQLYAKFAKLESTMSKLNSQMSYLMQ